MKAIALTKTGKSAEVFEVVERELSSPRKGEMLVDVATFGLNYADVMARNGLYNDTPPLPAVLGYEVVGTIKKLGEGVKEFNVGDRVVSLTRFGGYAQQAIVDERATVKIPDSIDNATATALATQYITAYYCGIMLANFQEGENVLIHAAAGGVGTALTQLAKWRKCTVWGTAGSDEKLDYLKGNGVDYPINYRKQDFESVIQEQLGEPKINVIFDPVGGKYFKKGKRLLSQGGRFVIYGVSTWSHKKGTLLDKLKLAWDFGLLHPLGLLLKSQSVMGVNMLKVGDARPEAVKHCMQEVVKLTEQGVLKPHVGKMFLATEIAQAHDYLESRASTGKVAVNWEEA